jgi:hypothetical protein
MANVDLELYFRGFKAASTRFADSGHDPERGFTATFEAVQWAAAIRIHLIRRLGGYPTLSNACPEIEGLYFVRNLVGHIFPLEGGGESPYLTEAIVSHGVSLAHSFSSLWRAPNRSERSRPDLTGLLHDTWSGEAAPSAALSFLSDTPGWRWRPRHEWTKEPSETGSTEYDDHLDGELVAETFAVVGAYLDTV